MISLREVVIDLENIKSAHVAFVGARARQVISYYHNVLETIERCDNNPRMSDKAFVAAITAANTSGVRDFKRLLAGLLKRGERVVNIEGIGILRRLNRRVFSATELPIIIKELEELGPQVDGILTLDLSSDLVAGKRQYAIWSIAFTHLAFLVPLIFDYDGWFLVLEPTDRWGPYQLTKRMGLSTCPYCNRIFTYTIVRHGGAKIARPQLDHFLPKSRHPLLALSFFNLIPSCAICNSSVKGSTAMDYDNYLSPYCDNPGHSLIRFSYTPATVAGFQGLSEELTINIDFNGDSSDVRLKNRVDNLVTMLCLREVYANHTDVVMDIIRKRFEAGTTYLDTMRRVFPGLSLTVEDLYRYAYGTYYDEKQFHLRPLSKLTKDLVIELKIRPGVP